uniref:Ferritin n=1 Tax=Myxobolus squamalis TaxID=59785 RepID=A0A6B2G2L7_MYXSQ
MIVCKLNSKMKDDSSQIRCDYSKKCEDLINLQINEELRAHYTYMGMAFHFDRDDVALSGFYKFFIKMSDEELGHARELMKFQNQRGGRIFLSLIPAPKNYDDAESLTPLSSMKKGLQMETDIYYLLKRIHKTASLEGDCVLTNKLEEMLKEQVLSIKEFGDFVTNLTRVGPGLGEYEIDHHLNN